MERSKADTKNGSVDGLNYPNQNENKHDLLVFYKTWKKYDEIQLTNKWTT